MKSVIILGDGMSDHPVAALDGRTPLMVANKPHIDRIAREGRCGRFVSIPAGMPSGSAVANLSVLGYDPRQTYQGRAVLEAASMGVTLNRFDLALRLNLIAEADGAIESHSAGHISTGEAAELIRMLNRELGAVDSPFPVEIHTGVSYRHLLVIHSPQASAAVECAPPHDRVGALIAEVLPRAKEPGAEQTAARLREIIEISRQVLPDAAVNRARRASGKPVAGCAWPWSPGRRPQMRTLQAQWGISGAVISAVDLVMGLGYYAGMELIRVPGATGLADTNYEGKAQAALDALEEHDLVYVHVEATDEAGHARDLPLKIRCIEQLDDRLVRPLLEGLEQRGVEACVAVLPDHPTPVETGVHATDPVPVAIRRPGEEADDVQGYDELQVERGALGTLTGDELLRAVIGR